MARRTITSIILLALLAGCGPLPFGFNPAGELTDRATRSKDMDGMAHTGQTWTRLFVRFNQIGGDTAGELNWGDLDSQVAAARRNHARIIGTFHGSPWWLRRAGSPPAAYPTSPSAWADLVWRVQARYRFDIIEVWNEPELWGVNGAWGAEPNTPEAYRDLYNATWLTLYSHGANTPVMLASFSPIDRNSLSYGYEEFLDRLYSLGVRSWDVMGFHPYTLPSAFSTSGGPRRLERLRWILNAHGDQGKALWVTEVGWGTCMCGGGVTESVQASRVHDLWGWWRGNADRLRLGGLVWYAYRDWGKTDAPLSNTGLVRRDGSYKPAWYAWQQEAR